MYLVIRWLYIWKTIFVGQKTWEHYFRGGDYAQGKKRIWDLLSWWEGVNERLRVDESWWKVMVKVKISENTLSLIFNYREIDQNNSGNLPKLVPPKFLLIKSYYITHSQIRVSDTWQLSRKRLKTRKWIIEKFKE